MGAVDVTKKHLEDLLNERESLLKLALGKNEHVIAFGSAYQNWYTRAVKLVELLGHDRLDEFVSLLPIGPKAQIYDCLKLFHPGFRARHGTGT